MEDTGKPFGGLGWGNMRSLGSIDLFLVVAGAPRLALCICYPACGMAPIKNPCC